MGRRKFGRLRFARMDVVLEKFKIIKNTTGGWLLGRGKPGRKFQARS